MSDIREVIQLLGCDGQPVGLYGVLDKASLRVGGNAQKYFDEAFAYAESAEATLFLEEGENLNVMEIVDEELEKIGLKRIFATECTTDVI